MRNRPLLSGFGALLIALSPAYAFAQTGPQTQDQQTVARPDAPVSVRDRPHPEYDPLGMRFGAFQLSGSLGFDVASTDNLFAAPSGPSDVDDIIYGETLSARLASDWSRNALIIDAGGRFTQHRDFSSEDVDTGYLRGAGRFDIGTSTAINASARIAHEVTPRTDPDDPHTGGPIEYDRSDASIGVEQRFVRLRLNADLSASDYSYDEAVQNFRDNTRTQLHGRATFEVSPRIGLLLDATADHRDYSNSPGLTSDGQEYLAGVTLDGDLFRGELSTGYFRRRFDGLIVAPSIVPQPVTFDGLAVEGRLEWFVTELTTVTLDASRDAGAEVGASVGLPYITTEVGIHADHELLRNVILWAEYRRGKREYDTISRDDDYDSAALGADYVLNRRVALTARFEHFNTDSTDPNHDYNVNTGTIGISLRL